MMQNLKWNVLILIDNTVSEKLSENPYNLANIVVVHTGTAAFTWNGAQEVWMCNYLF